MELNGRLKLIAGKVPVCDIICDIGTDHAYIPIYLVQKSICSRAIASDIRVGPLEAARRNIISSGLDSRIEIRLGAGLDRIEGNEMDSVVIAGMGGILTARILSDGLEKVKKARALVLQPMNSIEIVRNWMYENGFEIFDEELACEGEKLYVVMSSRWTGCKTKYDEVYYHIGRNLIDKKDPLLIEFLNRKIKQIDKTICGLENSKPSSIAARDTHNALKKDLEAIKSQLIEGGSYGN